MLWRIGAFLSHSSHRKQEMPENSIETLLLPGPLDEIQCPHKNCLQSKSSEIKASYIYDKHS
jgi:hypothetical protein